MLTKFLFTLLAVTVGFTAVSADYDLTCLFFEAVEGYECRIDRAFVPSVGEVRISGTHSPGKSNGDVTRVEIMEADMLDIPAEVFRTFPNLKFFRVWQGTVKRVPRTFNCNNLETFIASGLRIDTIVEGTFFSCPKIKNVNLGFNAITSIRSMMFPMNAELGEIFFEVNQINRVDTAFFMFIKSIKELRLFGNPCIDKSFNDLTQQNIPEILIHFDRCF